MTSILGTGIQEGLLLKPVTYRWAMDLYDQAVANTWFPNEIQLGEDLAQVGKRCAGPRHGAPHLGDPCGGRARWTVDSTLAPSFLMPEQWPRTATLPPRAALTVGPLRPIRGAASGKSV